MSSRARLVRAAFPGDRRVWLAAAAVTFLALIAVLVSLLVPRDFYTGTNSIRTRAYAADLRGQTLCTAPQRIPAGTGRIELELGVITPRPPLDLELRVPGRAPIRSHALGPATPHKLTKTDFPVPDVAGGRDFVDGTVCLRGGPHRVGVGGSLRLQRGDQHATLGGRPLANRIALWFRPPAGEKRSLASLGPKILLRAALFRPGFVGRWTYAAILLLLMPGLIYAGLRLLALVAAGVQPRIAVPLAVAAIAFAGAAAWSLVTPSFNAPDESEHFAYAQHLAETGTAPSGDGEQLSSEERTATDALRLFSTVETGDGKPPWLPVAETIWRVDRSHFRPGESSLRRDDGGGAAVATSAHSPLYYSLLVPPYAAGSGASIWTRLWLMRLVSALLGAVVAGCAVLVVREIVPRRPLLAVAAGLLVAFQPMFSFMSGAVNNDSGVNAAAAVLVYLLVRGLRRGLTVRLAAAIGAAMAITPLMKGTGFALYPAAVVAVGAMLWRARGSRAWARPAAALAGTAAGIFAVWAAVGPAFHRGAITTPGGRAPGAGGALHDPLGLAAYLWQVFLPKLSFMTDGWTSTDFPGFQIWVVRGFGAFGWYAMTFADWVYFVILAVMIGVAVMAVLALRQRRAAARGLAVPLAVLALAVIGVIGGVHAYYFGESPNYGVIPEQGRYAFPAITALAAIAVGSLLALPRGWRVPAVACLVAAMMWLDYAGQLTALARFYS
ncbi:MAG: hypothetical protein QOG86_1061 [Thermoleophilaceae bacterium]|nr:hypothetical protein [Thermoleophilaceae bacterium]